MNSQKGIGGIKMKLTRKALILPMALQFFAEPGEGGDNTPPATPPGNEPPAESPTGKTYTEEEFQSAIDKRVTQALKTSQDKWQQDFQKKLEQEKQESERLAKMSADQREKEMFTKQQEEFNKQKREFERERLTTQTLKTLATEDLPTECCDWIMANAETAEDIMGNVAAFKKMFADAVEKRLNDRTTTTTPVSGEKQKPNADDPFLKGLGL